MNEMDDNFYIDRIKNGDKAAYSYLVNRYSDMVYSLVFKLLKNQADAEDLSQEVFIAAFKSLPAFKGSAKFSTWLYRIAYNKAVSELRKNNPELLTEKESFLENRGGAEFQNSGLSDEEEAIAQLQKAIRDLSQEEQLLIMLHYFENQSIEEISQVTRLSESNVKVKLFRTRKKLKEQLELLKKEFVFILN